MRDRESAIGIRLWSQPMVTRREGVSSDKLHFGVSRIGTWSVMKYLPWGSQNVKMRNGEVNASFYEFNPTVQVKLNKIAGLLLLFSV